MAAAMMSKIFFVLNKPKYDESSNKKKNGEQEILKNQNI